ncbi:hypothetical protein FSP39_013914 [Pinctada imbricata]|uniref:Hedgehog N-terminal signalling domain-containing protein n=1 Tax=Pinctada imbricata TaxID=66713 RepID=A0AA88Y044_PINIB|nr:hypothetical protein FSP39_013914 [Pinctada imbricata]
MEIKKGTNNEASVKTYVSQIEGRSSGAYDFSIKSTRELTLSHEAKLWETPSIRVDMLPLSRFHRLPAMVLELNTSSIASLSVYATAVNGKVTVKGNFSTVGDFVVSKEYHSPTSPPTQQATVNNWTTSKGAGNAVLANTTFYYNVNVSQEIVVQPYIRWAKRDVHIDFSSPFKIRLDQGIVASSTATVSAIQNEAMSNITGYFDTSDNKVDVQAFGVQIWDVMMSPGQHQTETHVAKHSLFSRSKANCFGDPSDLDSGTCGALGTAIFRNSDDFDNLKKIFGEDLVSFTDDENKTCTWCGQAGAQCTSCSEYEVDIDRACADRLMTSSMATAITKLAKFVQAEWIDRKLVILDAWTEPTSQHPNGKFGNASLYNEGRAARIGISKPLTSNTPNVEVETDATIFNRFKELLHCSGFPMAVVDTPESVYEVCVAEEEESQSYDRKKKRRRRKRAIITNNFAVSDDWFEEKGHLTDRLIDLPGAIRYPSTIPNHLGTDPSFPKDTTAILMCGESDEDFKRENKYSMKKLFQFPFDNVEFEAEGPSDSWCGTETRQCKQCSHLTDSSDPMEWCESRIMNSRLIVRMYRLSKMVENKVVQKGSTTGKSISIPAGWTEEEFAKCRNGPAYGSLSVQACQTDMKLTSSQCSQCIKERSCCMSGCLQGDCQSGGICSGCDANDEWKMKLFDNTCAGDPCMFLNGAGFYVLLKILLLYEVCSPLRNDATMESWMADTNAAYTSGESMVDFFHKCLQKSTADVLKIHYPGGDWDPTIGVGFSLKGDNPSLLKETLDISDEDYQKILDGTKKLTEKQALYLFGIVTRTKLKGLWSTIRYDDLALLPSNVKIAIFNANYRGDFGQGVNKKFKTAVTNGNWEGAVSAYKSHPDYQTNYKCLTKKTHDICKRYDFNAKQFESMIKKTIKVGDSKNNRRRRSTSSSSPSWFEQLRQAGRAAKISMATNYSLTTHQLSNLAVEAGFDFVEQKGSSIYTCVKATSGTTSHLMQYPKINLHGVDPPTDKIMEYLISPYADYALSYPLLVDGKNEDIQLSDCYKIKDFKARNFRYLRLDTKLIECLDLASDYYESCIEVIPDSGYRSHSLNNKNIDDRHEEEKWRFNAGMAVEVRPRKNNAEQLEQMALTIMRSCLPDLRLKRLKLGMGTHSDRVYVDIRTSSSNDSTDIFQLWNVDNDELMNSVSETYKQLMKGGPFIQPTNKERACKEPALGKDNYYIKDPSKGICFFDFSGSFCRDTEQHRKDKAEELAEKLEEAAGSNQFPKSEARKKTTACLVETCGGCVGKGDKWEKKTRACLDLIQTFLDKSTSPFPMDKMKDHAAFFNIENPKSHVHSLACHDGNACIEDVQLHSILTKFTNEKYKPDPSKSSEELIFDPGNNPTPLLDLLEQEMAMKASGNVSVYIEKDTDMSSFYHLIKILMVYNKNVGFVNFYLTKDVKEDRIVGSIQRKIERWAQSSCPQRTRILVAPYDVHIISESRRKRSIERSVERNQRIHNMRNWEIDWLMTMT